MVVVTVEIVVLDVVAEVLVFVPEVVLVAVTDVVVV